MPRKWYRHQQIIDESNPNWAAKIFHFAAHGTHYVTLVGQQLPVS